MSSKYAGTTALTEMVTKTKAHVESVRATLDSEKQDLIEVSTMPVASADYVGTVLIYVGATTADYTQGQSYLCVLDSDTSTYSWEATASKVTVDNETIQENSDGELETVVKIFTGTTAEWAALTTDEKKKYTIANITDDDSASSIVDAVQDGNMQPVTSNAVYDALALKQNTLTFDTTPTSGSTNPVTSGGIYQAISNVTWSTVDGWTFGQTPYGLKIAYRTIQHSCGTTKSAGLFTNSYYSVQHISISNLGFSRCISAYADVYASYTENLFAKAVVDWDFSNVFIPFWSDANTGTWDGRVTIIGF